MLRSKIPKIFFFNVTWKTELATLSKLKQYFRVLHNCFPVGVRFSANQPGMRNSLPYSTRLSHATNTNQLVLLIKFDPSFVMYLSPHLNVVHVEFCRFFDLVFCRTTFFWNKIKKIFNTSTFISNVCSVYHYFQRKKTLLPTKGRHFPGRHFPLICQL